MKIIHYFTKTHLHSFLIIYILFTLWLIPFLHKLIDAQDHLRRIIITTLSSITGPMLGAVARDFAVEGLQPSLTLLMITVPILLAGILFQFVKDFDKAWVKNLKLVIWYLAWLFWFSTGMLSLRVAL